jgi:hypothetical protein
MIKYKLSVTYENGEKVDVTAGPRTQVAFEREHKVPLSDVITFDSDGVDDDGKPNVTAVHFMSSHMYWLAWHASKSPLGFDDWLDTVDEIEMDVDAADPTPPAPQAGS